MGDYVVGPFLDFDVLVPPTETQPLVPRRGARQKPYARLLERSIVSISDVQIDLFEVVKEGAFQRRRPKIEDQVENEWRVVANEIDVVNPIACEIQDPDRVREEILDLVRDGDTNLRLRKRLIQAFKTVADEPYNVYYMDQLSCYIQALIYDMLYTTDPKTSLPVHVPKPIGAGVSSAVTRGILPRSFSALLFPENVAPPYLLKSSTSRREQGSMLNEAIVGLYALNALRTQFPTFMYIYASFTYKSSNFTRNGGVTLYNNWDYTRYNVVETINNATTLREFLRSNPPTHEIYEIIVQVLCALSVANANFDYSHNDLHDANILVQTIPEPRTLRFELRSGAVYFVETTKIARIIDYGYSHAAIVVDGSTKYKIKDRPQTSEYMLMLEGKTIFDTGLFGSQIHLLPNSQDSLYDALRFLSFMVLYSYNKRIPHGSEWLNLLFKVPVQKVPEKIYRKWLYNEYSRSNRMDITIPMWRLFEEGIKHVPFKEYGVKFAKAKNAPRSFAPLFNCSAKGCETLLPGGIEIPYRSADYNALNGRPPIHHDRTLKKIAHQLRNDLVFRYDAFVDGVNQIDDLRKSRKAVPRRLERQVYGMALELKDAFKEVFHFESSFGGIDMGPETTSAILYEEIEKQLNTFLGN